VNAPLCPECLRTGQRSIVRETSRSRLTIAAVVVTTEAGKRTRRGGIQTTQVYHCSLGHSWSETTAQGIGGSSLEEVIERVRQIGGRR